MGLKVELDRLLSESVDTWTTEGLRFLTETDRQYLVGKILILAKDYCDMGTG